MGAPYINIHTHRGTGAGVEAGAQWRAEAGVHPWDVAGLDEGALAAALRKVEAAVNGTAAEPAEIWAVGEIGLDYAVAGPDAKARTDCRPEMLRERQKRVFEAQLRLAEVCGLPVVIHCVRAFEAVTEILAAHRVRQPESEPTDRRTQTAPELAGPTEAPGIRAVIFHGFVGSAEQAARAVRAGYYLSFGERSLASPKTVEALRATPRDRIFLETDDSLAPIAAIYARAAAILGVPTGDLARQLHDNYSGLKPGEGGKAASHPSVKTDGNEHKNHERLARKN